MKENKSIKYDNMYLLKAFPLKLITFLMLIVPLFISCDLDNFVNVIPEDRLDKSTFFSNESEVILALNGVYASVRVAYNHHRVYDLQEVRSDNVAYNQQDQPERAATSIFNETPGNNRILQTWQLMYNSINLANAVIQNSPEAEGDQVLINRAIGEAKFLRALSYFSLVRLYGDLPLRLNETVDFEAATVERSPVEEIYSQIIVDLQEAIDVLPGEYSGGSSNEVGRATRYAALTLLGKVHLQTGSNEAAEAALRQVIGQYSLLPDYGEIHAAGNDNTAESIFEISFNPSNNTGYFLPQSRFIPQSEASRMGIVGGGVTGILTMYPSQDLINAYEDGDLRKDVSINYEQSGDERVYISKFIDQSAASAGHNINMVLLRYADVLLMLAEAIGESDEAYGYINEIRERADLGPVDQNTPGSFLEKLMQERRVELAFEHHRWFDLLRLPDQQVISIMNAALELEYDRPFDLQIHQLLYPIPISEINASGGIVSQNPGY